MPIQTTLDPNESEQLQQLLSRRAQILEQISQLEGELHRIDMKLSRDSRWARAFEDALLDSSVLRAVGMTHFYDAYFGPTFQVRDVLRHQYYRLSGQTVEVDAVAIYELTKSGQTRTVGFELKLDNKADALSKAIEQAIVRRPLFDYFYIVYGGWYIYYAVQMAGDFFPQLSRYGIGLILRPADLHAERLNRPIVFYKSRRAGDPDGDA